MTSMANLVSIPAESVEAKAFLLGERIQVRGLGPAEIVSHSPLAFHTRSGGLVVVYRFGAVAFIGVDETTQNETIEALKPHLVDAAQPIEVETASLVSGDEDRVLSSGKLSLVDMSNERLLIVADALAKSVALADDERYLSRVFEQIEPFASNLAATGGAALTSKSLRQLLGEALVAQVRMVGRVEVEDKPELLWERPDLQRLHARLEEEYELDDRARALARKLKVVEECASSLAEISDSRRILRIEIAIVALIAFEIVLTLGEMISRLFGA